MCLEQIRTACAELVGYLAYLEKQEPIATGYAEKYTLSKEIQKCKNRIQYWKELLDECPSILGDLPSDFSFKNLLDESWGKEIFAQSIKIKSNRIHPETDYFLAHLIVATYWEKRSSERFTIQLWLYFEDPNSGQIKKESLSNDLCSLPLSDFPDFLSQLTDFTARKLTAIYAGFIKPFKLTIELFVPVDQLSSSLTNWCGVNSRITETYSIVLRCSDRFDPFRSDRLSDSEDQLTPAQLYLLLQEGWQRFQEDVPDNSLKKLNALKWLELSPGQPYNPRGYSGVKCYGSWLTANPEHVEHWQHLVESGTPLALWLIQGQSNHPNLYKIYRDLADCNRFEFLEKVREVLNSQIRVTSPEYTIGVFYEDPNYIPSIPAKEEKYFSWPGSA